MRSIKARALSADEKMQVLPGSHDLDLRTPENLEILFTPPGPREADAPEAKKDGR